MKASMLLTLKSMNSFNFVKMGSASSLNFKFSKSPWSSRQTQHFFDNFDMIVDNFPGNKWRDIERLLKYMCAIRMTNSH